MPTFYGPSVDIGHLKDMHHFLAARGWTLNKYDHLDDDGCPSNPEASWDYPHSYGGITMNEIDDTTPYPLTCRLDIDHGLTIAVTNAGNYEGCAEHIATDTDFEVDNDGEKLPLAAIATLLDILEPQARALNPRALLECRFFGSCGNA